ncbi:MAG: hypothetical protein KAQ74_05380, partial [Dehalococcoidia bacterium]|nr:hypothetical protein [Dehalococcoidia bacterium]
MNRRKIWVLILVLGLLLFVVGAIFVCSDINQHRMALRESFHEKCLLQTATFEEYAEQWIVRGHLDSLQASAQLLLMGSGLYVDVMLQDEILYSGSDPDLGAEVLPEPVAFDAALKEGIASFLPNGSVEANSPLILSGYKDTSIGLIRIGFSG